MDPSVPVSVIEIDVSPFWTASMLTTDAFSVPLTSRLPWMTVLLDPEGSIVISPDSEESWLDANCRPPTVIDVGVRVDVLVPSVTSMVPVTSRL